MRGKPGYRLRKIWFSSTSNGSSAARIVKHGASPLRREEEGSAQKTRGTSWFAMTRSHEETIARHHRIKQVARCARCVRARRRFQPSRDRGGRGEAAPPQPLPALHLLDPHALRPRRPGVAPPLPRQVASRHPRGAVPTRVPEHGVVTEAVPWAEHDSRFTRDFEDLVAWVAREMNQTAVKNLL